jgi:hypothetical protein
MKFKFPTKSARRESIDKQWLEICVGRKCRLIRMMKLDISLFLHNRVIITILRFFYFGQALERKREPGQIELDW